MKDIKKQILITKRKMKIGKFNKIEKTCIYISIVIIFLSSCGSNKNIIEKKSLNFLIDSLICKNEMLYKVKIYHNFIEDNDIFTFEPSFQDSFEFNDFKNKPNFTLEDLADNKNLFSDSLPKEKECLFYIYKPILSKDKKSTFFLFKYVYKKNNKYFWSYRIIVINWNDSLFSIDEHCSDDKELNAPLKNNNLEFVPFEHHQLLLPWYGG